MKLSKDITILKNKNSEIVYSIDLDEGINLQFNLSKLLNIRIVDVTFTKETNLNDNSALATSVEMEIMMSPTDNDLKITSEVIFLD